MLGILKSGAAYVPIDPKYPKERLALCLDALIPWKLYPRIVHSSNIC
jgi:non-ribosomal peptide synthetase component F